MTVCYTGPRLAGVFLLTLTGLLLGGCAGTPQSDRLLDAPPADISPAVELNEVPFHPQEAYQCGPASLAMLANWQAVNITPQALTPKLYIPGKKGSLQIELLSNTRRLGLIPYLLKPELDDLLREVEAGNPVLVFQNLALDWYPRWHYAVLIGYDLNADEVILRSGVNRRRINTLAQFERTWQRADRWAMLALKPGQLPTTVEYWRYLRALSAMEQVNRHAEAAAGYRAGLQQWPDDARLLMGLGNSQYAQGNTSAAMATWQQLLDAQPDYAPAHNNLAHLYLEAGNIPRAEHHARRAIALGDEHLEAYRQTLEEVHQRQQME
ncbi:PA2778 family cysteine peptidase [Thiohalophilus thiocyanatoxydans]|uniref:Tetratricopeptide repeat protein n=1 Tax=Thiohalophilus thiocyanatoxydans TaxID=381308 RepID=A0A4R8IU60_9GAMM|nr:PA2778 family cysteine peptidase [Thiohalophilus thiocyanatoxydans]TDY03974.1 tetratricopeptide repeat protein [Thiohalophilus thiocyanatoxydans]